MYPEPRLTKLDVVRYDGRVKELTPAFDPAPPSECHFFLQRERVLLAALVPVVSRRRLVVLEAAVGGDTGDTAAQPLHVRVGQRREV